MNAVIVDFQAFDQPDVQETLHLATDLGYNVTEVISLKSHNRKFLGKGQLQQIGQIATDYVIYNGFLSGLRIKQMENYIKAKILSRVDIIIQTFQARANTVEATLQIKLADLLYTRAKLVRRWTHLERQRSAAGVMGGPGEKQIELDKRMIIDQIKHIRAKLAKSAQDKRVQAQSRTTPIVALVGLANAGKTSLFNLLSESDQPTSPKAFQTLSPLMRKTVLNGLDCVMVDSVGFVTHLPPFLVKAFRSTLDQIASSDVILCLHDATNFAHGNQVIEYIQQYKKPIIHAVNKIDIAPNPNAEYLPISVKDNIGIDELKDKLTAALGSYPVDVELTYEQQDLVSWLRHHADQVDVEYTEHGTKVKCILSLADKHRFDKLLSRG